MEDPSNMESPQMEMEYWSHHQFLDIGATTAATTTLAESLIPTLRINNSSIVTSSGLPVYLHCLVENLGERSVS